MKHLIIGLAVTLFGLFVGNAGLASAGVGISIPMIPIGLYLTYRGWRIYQHEINIDSLGVEERLKFESLENTNLGKVGIGIVLAFIGAGTSSKVIGFAIIIVALWFIYQGTKTYAGKALNKKRNEVEGSDEPPIR